MAGVNKQVENRRRYEDSLSKRPGELIAEDSSIHYQAIEDKDQILFSKLKNEIYWQNMYHAHGQVPRLVCCQGSFGEDGSMPVYRHPSDQSLPLLRFTPMVDSVRAQVEAIVGHRMNHVLIQLYRNGEDYISEHSDKTLDVVQGSSIVNVSLGAQRTMRLRTKRNPDTKGTNGVDQSRITQLVPMPHASVFVLGPRSNERWLHGINHDKRPAGEKNDAEVAFDGERISLTFRNIGTFLSNDCTRIWGQGARSKEKPEARNVINGEPNETQRMINAFGYENQQSTFEWDSIYGNGFDVLHFRDDPTEVTLLFLAGEKVQDMKVLVYLEELGRPYRIAGAAPGDAGKQYEPPVCLRDIDAQRTEVVGDLSILLHLASDESDEGATARSTLAEVSIFRDLVSTSNPEGAVEFLEKILSERDYIVASGFSIADCAFWPIVHEIMNSWESWDSGQFPYVEVYHKRVSTRSSVQKAIEIVSNHPPASGKPRWTYNLVFNDSVL